MTANDPKAGSKKNRQRVNEGGKITITCLQAGCWSTSRLTRDTESKPTATGVGSEASNKSCLFSSGAEGARSRQVLKLAIFSLDPSHEGVPPGESDGPEPLALRPGLSKGEVERMYSCYLDWAGCAITVPP